MTFALTLHVHTLFHCVYFQQDILYICNKCGPVQRIVIFGKNRVQAMVEYPFESIHAFVRLDIFILSLHHQCQPQWL